MTRVLGQVLVQQIRLRFPQFTCDEYYDKKTSNSIEMHHHKSTFRSHSTL
jgi:hypothetical protein